MQLRVITILYALGEVLRCSSENYLLTLGKEHKAASTLSFLALLMLPTLWQHSCWQSRIENQICYQQSVGYSLLEPGAAFKLMC